MSKSIEGDARPECCRDPENLELVDESKTPSGSLAKQRCTECGRNHYVATGDPVRIGLKGGGL